MSTRGLSERERAVVNAVIAAYDAGGSFATVARELGLEAGTV